MNWEQLEEGLDGQSIAFFRDQESGDEIEVRDSYPNPVALMVAREDRYQVVYDRRSGLPDTGLGDSFARVEDALEYAVEGLMGDDLEDYELEGYL